MRAELPGGARVDVALLRYDESVFPEPAAGKRGIFERAIGEVPTKFVAS
jgi:hypothetical protein